MTAHEFARQLLAGPDLPIAFPSTVLSRERIAAVKSSVIQVSVGFTELIDCLLIEPEGIDDLDDLDDLDA